MLVSALVVGNVSLVSKIIWDWLKGRGEMPIRNHCEDHKNCLARMNGQESCISHIKQTLAAQAEKNENTATEMERGRKEFKEIKSDITSIKLGVKALIVVANSRGASINETDLFQI